VTGVCGRWRMVAIREKGGMEYGKEVWMIIGVHRHIFVHTNRLYFNYVCFSFILTSLEKNLSMALTRSGTSVHK
jgi:hypothetical protein